MSTRARARQRARAIAAPNHANDARALRYFARATSSRATPSYANGATHQSIPGGGGASGARRQSRAARARSTARRARRTGTWRGTPRPARRRGAGDLHGPERYGRLRQLLGVARRGGSGPPHVARQRAAERRARDADLGDDPAHQARRRHVERRVVRRHPGGRDERAARPSAPRRRRAPRSRWRRRSPCARSIVDAGAAT